MARRQVQIQESAPNSSRKRPPPDDDPYDVPDDDGIPAKRPRRDAPQPTPTKRPPGRPPKADNVNGVNGVNSHGATPSAVRQKAVVATPVKVNGLNGHDTPSRRKLADRSARRKSARVLIDRVVRGDVSDDEVEQDIARKIYESSEEDEDEGEGDENGDAEQEPALATPSRRRGRKPKKATTTRGLSPTQLRGLPPHEQYLYRNKPGLTQTSANDLSSLDLLTHDEYFSVLREAKNTHSKDIARLESLCTKSFPQWVRELSQGFSTCLYGYGSKRRLLYHFATHLSKAPTLSSAKIVIINGYVRTTSLRDILSTLGAAINPSRKLALGPPFEMTQSLLSMLTASPTISLILFVNSIDAPPMRKPGVQSILSQLAAHPQIHLVCSADTSDFPFLWDNRLRHAFNFVFHDCTTFAPYEAEIDVVDDVHELIDRKARRANGKEGVAYVLHSLPENAKNLFRLLVTEVLVAIDEDGVSAGEVPAVEYRMLYNKAVEEFICSSEMAFRTLLKESVHPTRASLCIPSFFGD